MLTLHFAVVEDQCLLWAEAPAAEASPALPVKREKPRSAGPADYPHDAGADGLRSALLDAGLPIKVTKRRLTRHPAWLPVKGKHLCPSPHFDGTPPTRGESKLAPWAVTALPLSAGEVIELLVACQGRHTLAPGVIVSNDLAYWAQALRFAGGLVARQRFLPALAQHDGRYRASWEPVLRAADRNQLAELARLLPPVSRALSLDEAATPPGTPATTLLHAFVRTMLDHLVRSGAPREVAAEPPRGRGRGRSPAFETLHDQWLWALTAPDGWMDGDAAALSQLAEQIADWRRPLALSDASPVQLCFRLEEPDSTQTANADGPVWYVRYLLQAKEDPSLLLPADEALRARGRAAILLKRQGVRVREYLLASLGQAARICPLIERSLKQASPGGHSLDTQAAHAFLTEKAAMLEQAGFVVLLPAWWTRTGTKQRLTARAKVRSPKLQGAGGLSLNALVRFEWEIALGGKALTLKELEALAALKAPLVNIRGQWVQVRRADIETALKFWNEKGERTATVREVVQLALGSGNGAEGLAIEGVRAGGWINQLLKQLEGRSRLEDLPSPAGFHGTLRAYQSRGYAWLAFLRQWGLGACLADDMGLGKTIQTLALIQHDWEAGGKRPVLLVCPTSVLGNWRKEAERFTPTLPVMVHHGPARAKGSAFKTSARQSAMVVSSYALLHRDAALFADVDWAGVVLDEAQNIKNPETKQARAARALQADYRVALTGTPVENNVGDLWSIMEFLNPGFLGTQSAFKRSFFLPIQTRSDPAAIQQLKRVTGPFILRRLKTDKTIIRDLPDKLEMKVYCHLTREQASLYAAVLKHLEHELGAADGIQRKGIILATLSKLKQVCNHPAQFLGDGSEICGRSGKLQRLCEMLDEVLEVGDASLVFTQFAEMGTMLQRYLTETFGREVLFLHGGVAKPHRDAMVERFQDDAGPRVFVLSLKAGGTGLNLTRANHVFHFDRWWNPAVENQATDRAFRIGQTRNVQVHKYLCAGTVEDAIDGMIERKQGLAEHVVGTGEGWLTELSNEELRNVFALREEAIRESE